MVTTLKLKARTCSHRERSNPSSTAQSYAISLTGNTATAGTDFDNVLANAVFSNGVTYDAGTGQITVPAGVTSFTVGYATTQDNI
ncbi:hypothetical protein NK318_10930 [Acinetobacter junii]|uniref:hypothetical protein n=1 Tax=Acinetobacter junii TaxID=40215 RepID=UPI0035F86169